MDDQQRVAAFAAGHDLDIVTEVRGANGRRRQSRVGCLN